MQLDRMSKAKNLDGAYDIQMSSMRLEVKLTFDL